MRGEAENNNLICFTILKKLLCTIRTKTIQKQKAILSTLTLGRENLKKNDPLDGQFIIFAFRFGGGKEVVVWYIGCSILVLLVGYSRNNDHQL